MPIKLRPNEMAFYPAPFVESEANLLVVTNQRVVQFGDAGLEEMPARDLTHVGRVSERPTLVLGILLLVVGLPLVGFGAYLFLTSKGGLAVPTLPGLPTPGAAPTPAAGSDDPAGPAANDDPAGEAAPAAAAEAPSAPVDNRLIAVALAVPGLLLIAGGVLLARRQRHLLLLRGGDRVMTLKTDSKMQQTLLLSTVQAIQTGAKANAPAPAPAAAPKVTVDDKGDPVKALQDLAAARQAGKIGDEEFVAKREILLGRINKR